MFFKKLYNATVYFSKEYPLSILRAISGLIAVDNDAGNGSSNSQPLKDNDRLN